MTATDGTMKIVTFPRTDQDRFQSVSSYCRVRSSAAVDSDSRSVKGYLLASDEGIMSDDSFDVTALPSKLTTTPPFKNLKRRSSFQKIMHVCNQSCQVFPHVFLWMQGFSSTLSADVRKIIPIVKSFLVLRLGVFISIALLFAELLYCLVVALAISVPSGLVFPLSCIGILSYMAFQTFHVVSEVKKKLRGSFFVKKKIQ